MHHQHASKCKWRFLCVETDKQGRKAKKNIQNSNNKHQGKRGCDGKGLLDCLPIDSCSVDCNVQDHPSFTRRSYICILNYGLVSLRRQSIVKEYSTNISPIS